MPQTMQGRDTMQGRNTRDNARTDYRQCKGGKCIDLPYLASSGFVQDHDCRDHEPEQK